MNNYTIQTITNQQEWSDFFNAQQADTFLHTWEWGKFNSARGIIRLGAYSASNELVGVCLLLKINARRGSYLFCPHGPIIKNDNPAIVTAFIQQVEKIGRDEKFDFIRFSPTLPDTAENVQIFKDNGFRPAPIHEHPELAWTLDITPS